MDITTIPDNRREEVQAQKKFHKAIANLRLLTKKPRSLSRSTIQGKRSLDTCLPTEIIMMMFDCLKHVAPAGSWCLALTSKRFLKIFDTCYRRYINSCNLRELRDNENLYGVKRISVPLYKLLDEWMGPEMVWNEWKSKFTTWKVLEDQDEGLFSGGTEIWNWSYLQKRLGTKFPAPQLKHL